MNSDHRGAGGGEALSAAGVRKFETLAAACCDPRLAHGDVAVLAVILRHANAASGAAWPGVNRIAAQAKINRSSVMRSITKLEQSGFIEVDRSHRGRSNTYRPCMPTSGVDATSSTDATSGTDATELVALVQPQLVASMRPEHRKSEHRQEHRKPSRASALDEQAFAEFWDTYPKKVEKADAAKMFRKLTAAEIAAAIADVKRRNAGEWATKDSLYIVGPSKYLRGRRWEDDPPTKTTTARPHGIARSDFASMNYETGVEAPNQ